MSTNRVGKSDCGCSTATSKFGPGQVVQWMPPTFAENMADVVRSGKPLVLLFHDGTLGNSGAQLTDMMHVAANYLREADVPMYPVDVTQFPQFVEDFASYMTDKSNGQMVRQLLSKRVFPCSMVFPTDGPPELIPLVFHNGSAQQYIEAVNAATGPTPAQQKAGKHAKKAKKIAAEKAALEAERAALEAEKAKFEAQRKQVVVPAPLPKQAPMVAPPAQPAGTMVCCLIHADWCGHCQNLVRETWTEAYQDSLRKTGVLVFSVEIKSKSGHDAQQLIGTVLPMLTGGQVVPQSVPCMLLMCYKDGAIHADAVVGYLPSKEYKTTLNNAMKALSAMEAPPVEEQSESGDSDGDYY